ncbi:MAG: DNA methyltransferase [Parvularculales bacterium]
MVSIKTLAEKLDWECLESDTSYLTHDIHRYSGKFIPQIARNAIEILSKEDDLVLDVYAGSGTTLLEAACLKRHSIGVDLNPLATIISMVKTTPIDKEKLFNWHVQFNLKIKRYKIYEEPQLFEGEMDELEISEVEHDERLTSDWHTKWFQIDRLKELIWIDQNVRRISDSELRSIAIVALSDVLRRSSNAHSSYPNVMLDKNKKKVSPVIPCFLKRLDQIVQSISTIQGTIQNKYIPRVIEGSNLTLNLEEDSVDAVITHPPYIGSIPYAEYGILSLTWLNHNSKELDASLTGGQRQRKNVIERFSRDYQMMFREAGRVLKQQRHMFILVGNPTVKGEIIDLTEMSIHYATEAGLKLDFKLSRKGVNRRANKMGEETGLFFLNTN